MRDEDEKNRAQLAAMRLELARELAHFGVVTPPAGASAEEWDRFLVEARQAANERPDLVGLLCLISDVLRGMDDPERLPPPAGAFVRAPAGELLPLFIGNAVHESQ